jgi:phosphatidylinositol alpha-1,6-mannosyltransferase
MTIETFAIPVTLRAQCAAWLRAARHAFRPDRDSNPLRVDDDNCEEKRRVAKAAEKRTDQLDWLALVTDAFGGRGGIAQYNRHFLSALARERRVHVLPRHQPDEIDELPTNVTQQGARSGRIAFAVSASRIAFAQRPRYIFCGHLYMLPLAALLARLVRARLIVQVHGIEAWRAPPRLVQVCIGAATLWLAVSRYTRRRLLAWSNIDPARIRVLPNTLGEAYRPSQKLQHLIELYGLHGRQVILTVGRLASGERYKGHDRIIAALPRVLERLPQAVYLIVGTGDDVPRLKAEARQAGVADHVIFAGHVPTDALPEFYALADVFAMPSSGEGFGIVFLEAVRSGIPVIAGNGEGSVDALADGALGQLVDPDNGQQLVDAIINALERRVLVDPSAVDRFAFEHFSRHMNDLLRSTH